MRRHLSLRVLFFGLGILAFYAPFALIVRLLLLSTGSRLLPDAHRICLRMPFEWALQPWMYPTMIEQPIYLIGPLLLPAVAFFFGPLFCGWLCPAGALTELLGRLIPDRWKLNPSRWINAAVIRLGVLAGMLISPFLGSYVCCTFCNFTMMQSLVSAVFGDATGLVAWSSFTAATFVVWFALLGLFVKGGRGWCNLICPAGAVQGLAHSVGARTRVGRAIRIDGETCRGCGRCAAACPAWAIGADGVVSHHACNVCRDCLQVCTSGAIRYGLSSTSDETVSKER